MPKVNRVNKYKKTGDLGVKSSTRTRRRKPVVLSTKKSQPSGELYRYPIVIYGEKKIGKTTLLSQFPSAYSFMFEPNDSYALYKDDILNWEDFSDLTTQFLQGKHDYKSCWIDNGRNCYNMVFDFVCKKNGVDYPPENDFGRLWKKIEQEFTITIRRLMQSSYGFGVTCHETTKDIETRTGRTFVEVKPDLPAQAMRLFVGEIYNVFYYYYEGSERFLQIQGDDYITAGHRMKNHFLTPNGEIIHKIPMGTCEEDAYSNLIRAFNNEQVKTYAPTIETKEVKGIKKNKYKKAKR